MSVPTLVNALSQLTVAGGLEIILVNDGSQDDSLGVCRELARKNSVALSVIDLARNFGEHNAVMAGLTFARGAHVITMDDDLQNPPEEVLRLWSCAKEGNYDVVYTCYSAKQHSAWRNLGSRIANRLANWILSKPRWLYLSSFRCINARTVAAIIEHTGPFPYIDGLILQTTSYIGKVQVDHHPRADGKSNYTTRRLIRLFTSMFLNFSVMPLRVATVVGFTTAGVGLLGLLDVFIEAVSGTQNPRGWASLVAATLLLSGVQLMMLGLVGEYLGRMFLTVNKKPQFVVRDIERNSRAALDG